MKVKDGRKGVVQHAQLLCLVGARTARRRSRIFEGDIGIVTGGNTIGGRVARIKSFVRIVASEAEFVRLMLSKPIVCAMIHIVLDATAFVLLDGDAKAKIVVSAFFSTLVLVNPSCIDCERQHVMLLSNTSSS